MKNSKQEVVVIIAAFIGGLVLGYFAAPKEKNFNDNFQDCQARGGDYAFSVGKWDYERCTIEKTISY